MFRKLICLFSLVFVLSLVSGIWAQDAIFPSPGAMPVIDGRIDEVWFFSEEYTIGTSQVGAAPSSPADCSGTWRALWNWEALYVLVEVNDESLTNDSGGGNNKWNDDSVEIYVDGDNSKRTSPDTNDHQYTFWWGDEVYEEPSALHNGVPSIVGVEYVCKTTPEGYMLEVKLPWMSIMGEAATPGQEIGFDVWINDDDDGGDRDSQVSWYSTDGNGWQDPSVWGVAILEASNKAANPNPPDGAIHTDTWATLSWLAAPGAVSHDVYFGESFADVEAGTGDTFQVNQATTFYVIGFPGFPYPDGLVQGTRYYWRIDEVSADGTKFTGDVWTFLVPPKSAYEPYPADDAKFVDPDVTLSWTPGHGAKIHTVYFGDDFDSVSNATTGGAQTGATTYTPDPLEREKTYYWRVDEFDGAATHTGDVWSFKTAKAGGGVRGDYYKGRDHNTFVLSRTDPEINFTWMDPDAPDPAVGDNDFSIRWTGEVEAGYTETYTFYPKTDDGVRLWVDGRLLADSWATVPIYPIEHSGTIDLVAGNTYTIVMEYFEDTTNAIAELRWESPSTPKQIVPQAALALPVKANSPSPRNGATGVKLTPVLKWGAGDSAASHEVYFGTDEEAVKNATTASPEYKGTKALGDESYDPGKLAWHTTYYWRVDEVNNVHPDSPWIGSLWSFTTGDFLVVDSFEDYTDDDAAGEAIWQSWIDGFGVADNGAQVGYLLPPYAEQTIVHSGAQSMPVLYINTGGVTNSEAMLALTATRDWTEEGVADLSLWFRGYPGSAGSFVEGPVGIYTMTGSGTDIWDQADEFHFAYKTLTGVGSIVAKVMSVDNTNNWAKAGVMIRESLEPGSVHATMVVTPAQGVSFQRRTLTDNASSDTTTGGIEAPYWVKIERDISGNFTASSSADGTTWTVEGSPENIQMASNVYIGLAVTSHDAAQTCQAVFTNVTTTGNVSGQWANQDIGLLNNDAEPLYVAVSNSSGNPAVVVHDDPAAAQIDTWTEWVIPLQTFADQGIVLTNVDKIAIGLGTKANVAAPGGSGKMFFDDIRLYRPQP